MGVVGLSHVPEIVAQHIQQHFPVARSDRARQASRCCRSNISFGSRGLKVDLTSWMASFQLLLLLGLLGTVQASTDLDCTNDFETMSCRLGVEKCSFYSVNIRNENNKEEYSCSLEKCGREQCCCSAHIYIIIDYNYTIKAFRGHKEVNSTRTSILQSLKPRTPTSVSVKESEGIFTFLWESNMDHFPEEMQAEVSISKKGHTVNPPTVSKTIQPAKFAGLQSYQINGRDLEPNTAYVLSVRSYTTWSRKFSDRSEEVEIKVSSSKNLLLAIVISLSIFGIFLLVAIYICLVKIKRKWWDSFAEPKKLFLQPRKPEFQFYKPQKVITSEVLVTTPPPNDTSQTLKISNQQGEDSSVGWNSSGGSSDLCYGHTEPLDHKAIIANAFQKALSGLLPNTAIALFPPHELPSVPREETEPALTINETSSSGVTNPSYFIPVPKSPSLTTEDSCAVKQLDVSSYSCNSDTANCSDQELLARLFFEQKQVSSGVKVDMSYRPCTADPKRSSYADNGSLTSTSRTSINGTSSGFDHRGGPGLAHMTLGFSSCDVNSPDQEVLASLFSGQRRILSDIRVDMSYQPLKTDPKRSSYGENTSLSSASSDTSSGFDSSGHNPSQQ